jgi:hypothetical protein
MTATVAPLRVISISSPSETRVRTSENERAACVAVILIIAQLNMATRASV